jgi:starch synthase
MQKYNRRSLDKKSVNKSELQKELMLPVDASIPMIGMISRLVEQKGLDIILQSLTSLFSMPVQLVILGTGDARYELQLTQWAQKYPDQLKVVVGYNEPLAHRIEAASDLYLMPSTFEPCGLNQLYSLRYGSLPIVTPVGGLADTVFDASENNIHNGTANGFVLGEESSTSLLTTVKRALALFQKPAIWRQLQLNAMGGDFSWIASARYYISLYQQALMERR